MDIKKFDIIVEKYRMWRDREPDQILYDCATAPDLPKAIEMAAQARNAVMKKHPHQFRIPNSVLKRFSELLQDKIIEIGDAQTFQELYNSIDAARIKGIGVLTLYDTAHRIGSFKRIPPDKIYLHSGARLGAEKLMGRQGLGRTIAISQLPEPIQGYNLTAADFEDIFCHFKPEITLFHS